MGIKVNYLLKFVWNTLNRVNRLFYGYKPLNGFLFLFLISRFFTDINEGNCKKKKFLLRKHAYFGVLNLMCSFSWSCLWDPVVYSSWAPSSMEFTIPRILGMVTISATRSLAPDVSLSVSCISCIGRADSPNRGPWKVSSVSILRMIPFSDMKKFSIY